jgi:hypothetical protein
VTYSVYPGTHEREYMERRLATLRDKMVREYLSLEECQELDRLKGLLAPIPAKGRS